MKRICFLSTEDQILSRKQLDALMGGKMGNCGCACLGETDPSKGSGTVDNAYANDANGKVSRCFSGRTGLDFSVMISKVRRGTLLTLLTITIIFDIFSETEYIIVVSLVIV